MNNPQDPACSATFSAPEGSTVIDGTGVLMTSLANTTITEDARKAITAIIKERKNAKCVGVDIMNAEPRTAATEYVERTAPATGAPILLPRLRNVPFIEVARPISLGSTERTSRFLRIIHMIRITSFSG